MDCGVGVEVMSFEFVMTYLWNGGRVFPISSSESLIASSMCGGELSSLFGL